MDPTHNLHNFNLAELAPFKLEKCFHPKDSADFRVFYAGRDDVHGVLKYLLRRCTQSLTFNMFGYDDPELDSIIRGLITAEHVFVQGTLDLSQASGIHEKALLTAWTPEIRASFAIGESATHQISHTKGGVIDGTVAWEGSTNWSATGEGFGGKAQNNTLAVYTNPVEIEQFRTRLNEEHATALQQQIRRQTITAASS